MHEPSYMEAHRNGKLAESIDKAVGILGNCLLCPRECKVNRLKDERGVCRTEYEQALDAVRAAGISRLDTRKRRAWHI